MQYRPLGDSGVSVSPLTVGCWSFGGDERSYWGGQSQREVDQLVREALDLGVNLFDTAFMYNEGASEISLGRALAGQRERALICNKIPIVPHEEIPAYEDKITASLKRLRTDYIDILMIHWPTRDERLLRENLEAILRVQQRGLVHRIGVSNFGVRTLQIAREMGVRPVADELAYNLISRGIEKEILPYCVKEEIGVVAYMPIMQGILTGKFDSLGDIPPARRRTIHFDSRNNPAARHGGPGVETELPEFLTKLSELARQSGMTPGDLSIAWVSSKPGISSVIAGCRSVDQLRQNVRAAETPLAADMVSLLNEASEKILGLLGPNADLWESPANSRVW
ncbi:MAG: aldo/keto reductase [Clostridiales bacterium]|nr:aldo/keto reductase [Clostridiales bacterium]